MTLPEAVKQKIEEEWKNIKDYSDYLVSNFGNVKNKKGFTLNPQITRRGYCRVSLYKNKKSRSFFVHRIVLNEFVGKSELVINHLNGIKTDNRLCNLEYCTRGENNKHAKLIGLNAAGEKQWNAKLKNGQVLEIFNSKLKSSFLAKKFKVTRRTINQIRCGDTWQSVTKALSAKDGAT